MSELKNIQEEQNSHRKQTSIVNLDLQQANASLEKLKRDEKQELKGLTGQASEARKNFYDEQKKSLAKEIEKLAAKKKSLTDKFQNVAEGFLSQLNPVEKIAELNDNMPILMFPLRLETRFKSTGNIPQLWLRVYPDDCNINSKEDLLSESELKNAKSFWTEMWKAGGIEAEEKAAWRSLVNSHGTGRAAWIIEAYKPTNNKTLKPDESYKIFVVNAGLVLTSNEKSAATNYWFTVWFAKGDVTKIATADADLIAATSVAKAAEIKEKYMPVNLADELPLVMDMNKIIISEIALPDYTAKQSSWTQSAKTMALPDKFVVTTYTGKNKKTILFQQPVKEMLAVSVDPSLTGVDQIQKDADKNLILNEELNWMVDFDKALAVGMATKINLTAQEATAGFDKIFVTGIRFTSDATDGKEQLEKLFTDHFHSKSGFELLQQGTPTNNTEDIPAGYIGSDNGDESFDAIFKSKESFTSADTPDKKSDGEKLADCLGIDAAFLKMVNNANGKDQLEAYAMNSALFPATIGYFMEEMMHPLFSDKDIDAAKTFFSGFVSGRGPIPALRISKQPYGILPISVYSKLNFFKRSDIGLSAAAITNSKTPFLARMHSLLMKMDATWDSLLPSVAHIGKTGDPHQILLDVIGLHANSAEFHQRYSQSIIQVYNQLTLQFGPFFASFMASFIEQKGKAILQNLGIALKDVELPILQKYFLSKPNLLSGALVDDVPDSETEAIRPYTADGLNYIEWLTSSSGDKIRMEDFGGNPSPTALLYLLLKHAITQAECDAGAKMLISNNVVASKKVFYDPDLLHVEKSGIGKSKYEHLYSAYPSITGNSTLNLIEHIHNPIVLKTQPETKLLQETIDALKILERTPTARLARLFEEHLDCCSYRMDAWKTGLVQYKLTEQRYSNSDDNTPSKGIYLGAYGWLLDVKPQLKVLTNENLSTELNEIFNKGNNTPLQSDSTNLGYIHAPSLNQASAAAILRNAYDSNKGLGSGNPFAINLTSDRVRIATNFLEGMRNGQSLAALLGYQFERGLHDKYSLGQGEVDKFIYPLRKAFPLVADNLKDTKSKPEESKEAIEANNVIDGLKFIDHVQKSSVKTYPFGLAATLNLPAANATQAKAIHDELNRIIDINDAISDLVISEQVYQVVQGNFERASGNAEAFSKGSYPPDIEIMNTPRSGVTLTHRMAIQFDANAPVIAGAIAKAKAEPSVNKWLADNLPPPEKVLCSVTYSSPVIAATTINISQKEIGLQAIDMLYVFSADTEQAMTELDDRILSHIRYNISNHPKTEVTINYTNVVDAVDKSNVSFFELTALIKSLRKILLGTKFISPAQVLLATETVPIVSILDDIQLKNRITTLQNELLLIKTACEVLLNNTKSIASFSTDLKTQIGTEITDTSKVEAIINQLKIDIKEYVVNPIDQKIAILTAFESSINTISNAATIASLKASYESYLNEYKFDFANFDTLIKITSEQFLLTAMYDNVQTGIGFMHSAIIGMYENIFSKIDTLITRWDKKIVDYDAIMLTYNPAGVPEEQFDILKNAERLVSSQSTFPLPALAVYKTAIDAQRNSFDLLLVEIKSLKVNAKPLFIDFINDVETVLKNISAFDVIPYDIANERNDLKEIKLQLVLLKEDIVAALSNIQIMLSDKIDTSTALITESDTTIINVDKISALLNAAKKIVGDEALLLPQFTLSEPAVSEFENSFTESSNLLTFVKTKEDRIFPVEDWLGGVARVREKVSHWENISVLANAFNAASVLDMTPIQFPYQVNDRWLAMKFRDENDPTEKDADGKFIFNINNDKLLYTAHYAAPFDKTKPQCGIVLDEWTEVIPANEETTGIAFHYNQPNSEPPQTMLLVTPPQITGNWKWDDIIEAMEETLDMAKKRAVEPSQIETTGYAQFLPSTMMAVTMHWITMATNLSINNNIYKKINNGS